MDFQKKPRLTPGEVRLLSLIGFIAALVLIVLIGVNIGLSRAIQGGGEFYSAWNGARMFLFSHVNPYNYDVALQAQQLAYGHPVPNGQNPYYLTVPFYLLLIYFPFAFITDGLPVLLSFLLPGLFLVKIVVDPSVVRGLWLIINESALLITALLILRLIEWSPRRLFLIAFFLLSIFSFYSISALLDGTPVILLCLLYFWILYSLKNGQDELVGALLVLTFFRWEVGLPFLTLVIWRVYHEKRSRVFNGFGMLSVILLIASFLMNPGWVIPFLRSSWTDLQAHYGFTSSAILLRLWPTFDQRFIWILPLGLIILLGIEWYSARGRDFHHFIWTCCLTLAVTPLIGFRAEYGTLVALFPALALIFATVVERWHHGYWLNLLLYLIVLVLPWGLFIRSVLLRSQFYQDILSIFFPVFILAGLYWTRWWYIHPPRTWLDYVRSSPS